MTNSQKDYHVTLMKLQKQNQEYRDELKDLSKKLDKFLAETKKPQEPVPDSQTKIENLNKKISVTETEIKQLKLRSPRSTDRLSLENTISSLKDEIKATKSRKKGLKNQLEEQHKILKKSQSVLIEQIFADLKIAKKKLKNAEEKYSNNLKQHSFNLEELQKLEEAVNKQSGNRVEYLKFNTNDYTNLTSDLTDLRAALDELETQKKAQKLAGKQENEKFQLEISIFSEQFSALKKDLKSKVHESNSKDHEINELKRKLRSVSAKRFSNSPDIGQYEEEAKTKLQTVRSENRLPPGRKPPRPDSNSPLPFRVKKLRSGFKPDI